MEFELYQDQCTGFQNIKYLLVKGIFIGIVERRLGVPHILNENLLLRCHVVHHFKNIFKQKQRFKKMKLVGLLIFIQDAVTISSLLNIANKIQFTNSSQRFHIFRQCHFCHEIGHIGFVLNGFNQITFGRIGCNLCNEKMNI